MVLSEPPVCRNERMENIKINRGTWKIKATDELGAWDFKKNEEDARKTHMIKRTQPGLVYRQPVP